MSFRTLSKGAILNTQLKKPEILSAPRNKIVREKRNALGISQEKLAELAGLHFTYVSSVERGERNLSLSNIAKLAKALGCSMKDLMPF